MDLMTSSTNFLSLEKKYHNFVSPSVQIKIDSVEIIEKLKAGISNLEINLTCGYEASGCSFDVISEYEPKQTNFSSDGAYSKLQLGAKVELLLGYIEVETVFYGLITEISYIFDNEDAPYIHVECMDAKCLMMKMQRLEIRSETKVSQAVNSLLSGQPVSGYLKGKQILNSNSICDPLHYNMESDYDFIVKLARYTGCEFFIIAGKVYFREIPKAGSLILSLSPQDALLSARFSLRGTGLVKKVTVMGIDPKTDKEISGNATSAGKFSKGSTANQMLSSTERVYFDPRAISAKEAGDRAKIFMVGIENQFGFLECSCIGIPEIVPGRTVKVSGLMTDADKSFYITEVRHRFDEDGFTTFFEARINSL